MATKKNNKPPAWTPTELLYAFTGWMTTRKKPMVFGSAYNAAPIAELIGEFIKINKLPQPGDRYPKVKVPVNTDDLTNIDSVMNAVARPPLSPNEAVGLFASKLAEMSTEAQDVTLASLLDQLRKERLRRLGHMERQKRSVDEDHDETQNAVWNLEKIARGDFYVVKPGGPMALTEKKENHA